MVISDEEIDYMKVDDADVFVALNQAGFNKYLSRSKKNAMVLINSTLVQMAVMLSLMGVAAYMVANQEERMAGNARDRIRALELRDLLRLAEDGADARGGVLGLGGCGANVGGIGCIFCHFFSGIG